MPAKTLLFASTLAVALCFAAAPAQAQYYTTGGSYVSVGGPSGYLSIGSGPVVSPIAPVVSPYAYPYVVPTSRVIVQPYPLVRPMPYGVYHPGWGPRPYGGYYGPRPYGYGHGRRGWW